MDYLMVYKYYYDDEKSMTQNYSFEHPAWNESKVFNGIVYFHDSCEEITDDDMDTAYWRCIYRKDKFFGFLTVIFLR